MVNTWPVCFWLVGQHLASVLLAGWSTLAQCVELVTLQFWLLLMAVGRTGDVLVLPFRLNLFELMQLLILLVFICMCYVMHERNNKHGASHFYNTRLFYGGHIM
jgi:hypothetical protein